VSRSIPRARHAEFYKTVVSYMQYDPILGGAILATLFTGLRAENIQELLWSEIKDHFIEIPAHKVKYGYMVNKGKPIKIPMNDHLRWVFEQVERICGRHSSGYVFPTQSFKSKSPHITSLSKKIMEIGNDMGIVLSAHDLRHTFLGVCLEAKISWIGTKRLAGHSLGKDGDITAAYQETDYEDDDLIIEAEKVSRYMARRCGLEILEPLTEAERIREAENQQLRDELARMRDKETETQRQIQRMAKELSAVRSLLSQQQSAR
jgi:integrase